MSEKKIVGITMGDPASIGPEITVKAFADKSLYDLCDMQLPPAKPSQG